MKSNLRSNSQYARSSDGKYWLPWVSAIYFQVEMQYMYIRPHLDLPTHFLIARHYAIWHPHCTPTVKPIFFSSRPLILLAQALQVSSIVHNILLCGGYADNVARSAMRSIDSGCLLMAWTAMPNKLKVSRLPFLPSYSLAHSTTSIQPTLSMDMQARKPGALMLW